MIHELIWCDERFAAELWPAQIRWAIAEMFKVADRAGAEGLGHVPPERLRRSQIYYDSGIQAEVDHHPVDSATAAQSKQTNLLLRLRDEPDDYLRFTRDPTVPATNNQAERDLRPIKTQLKISGCHAAENGARNWLAIRSYLVTALKYCIGALDAVRRAILGDPWMPPLAILA